MWLHMHLQASNARLLRVVFAVAAFNTQVEFWKAVWFKMTSWLSAMCLVATRDAAKTSRCQDAALAKRSQMPSQNENDMSRPVWRLLKARLFTEDDDKGLPKKSLWSLGASGISRITKCYRAERCSKAQPCWRACVLVPQGQHMCRSDL